MNLNFIELLAILQLITIQNSSDGNNIKPQAIRRLVKFSFLYATLETSANNFVFGTKNNTLRPLALKGCEPLDYRVNFSWSSKHIFNFLHEHYHSKVTSFLKNELND